MCAVEQLKGVISFRVDMIYDDKYYDVQKKIIDLVESGMDDYDAFDAADFSKCESQLIITTDSCDADAASDVISRIISDIHTQLPPAIKALPAHQLLIRPIQIVRPLCVAFATTDSTFNMSPDSSICILCLERF